MGGSGTHPELSQRRVPRWVHRRVVPGRARVGEIESPLRVHGSRLTLRDRGDEKLGKLREPRRDRGRASSPGADARGSGSVAWSRGELSHAPTGRAGCAGSIVPPARRSLRGTTTDEIVTSAASPRWAAPTFSSQLAAAAAPRAAPARTARWDANETSRGEARSFRSYNHLTFDAC